MPSMEYGTEVTATILSVDGDDGHGRWEPIYDRITTDTGRFRVEPVSLATRIAGNYVGARVVLSLSERGRVYTLRSDV